MAKILILGASGMLGHRVALEFIRQGNHKLVLTGGKNSATASKFFVHMANKEGRGPKYDLVDYVDLLSSADTQRFLNHNSDLDYIINCAGILKHHHNNSSVEATRKMIRLNADLPAQLCQWADDHNKEKGSVITFSSDCVFQGTKAGPYNKFDMPDATDLYGRTKAIGELNAPSSSLAPKTLTLIRTSIIGFEIHGHTSLLEWLIHQEEMPEPISGYYNAQWSGVSTAYLAKFVSNIISGRALPIDGGFFQIASNPINKYDLLKMLIDRLDLEVDIKPDYKKFIPGKVCNRVLESDFTPKPSWEYDGLISDIHLEYEFYKDWRVELERCKTVT